MAYLNEKGAKNGNIDMDNLDREAWDKHMSKLDPSNHLGAGSPNMLLKPVAIARSASTSGVFAA